MTANLLIALAGLAILSLFLAPLSGQARRILVSSWMMTATVASRAARC